MDHIKAWIVIHWRFLVGWKRIRHGYCPACNSSAPALYGCTVCRYYSNGYPPTRMRKAIWWARFRRWVYCPTGYVDMIGWMKDLGLKSLLEDK